MDLDRFDLLLVVAYTFAGFLLASAATARSQGTRVLGVVAAPAAAGLIITASMPTLFLDETASMLRRIPGSFSSIGLFVAAVVGAIAVTDMLLNRFVPVSVLILGRVCNLFGSLNFIQRQLPDIANSLVLGVSVLSILGLGLRLQPQERLPGPPSRAQVGAFIEASYELPGHPTGLVFWGQYDGYIALDEGRIIRFELPIEPGGDLATETVVDGINSPRGITILNGMLFVTDLGPLPCGAAILRCKRLPGLTPAETELTIIESSRAGVLAFDILPDGKLENRRVVLSDLPVANTDHAINGLEAGPDGRLYLAIGGTDANYKNPEAIDEIERPNLDLLGTIVTFMPDGSDLSIFARGLRNVYGLTFDDKERLYGTDNDGSTLRGRRREEVLQIKAGAHYGYPYEGTFGPYNVRTDDPIWILDTTVGSAAIEWSPNVGIGPGLIIGSQGRLEYVPFSEDKHGYFVSEKFATVLLDEPRGAVTIVEAAPQQRLLVGVWTYGSSGRPSVLHVLRLMIE